MFRLQRQQCRDRSRQFLSAMLDRFLTGHPIGALPASFYRLTARPEFAGVNALVAEIGRFLRALPARDCDVFLRRYWYGESLAEIAGRYGLKLNTVKTSLYRTREKLRRHLEQEGYAL